MFNYDEILKALEDPNNNGILLFVLGFLSMLTLYNFLLYFQNNDKVYLYYTLYVGLILASYLNLISSGFFELILTPFLPFLNKFEVFFKWSSNCVYFIFAFKFVNIKDYSVKWDKRIKFSVIFLISIGVVFQTISLITGDNSYIQESFFLFCIPIVLIMSGIGYYLLYRMSTVFRYYIIIGSLFLLIASIAGSLIFYFEWLPRENRLRDSILYFGLIVENIFFSLGLGHKQKLLYEESSKQKELKLKAMVEAQEVERGRIARELHDGVVQQIGSVILKSRNILSKMKLLEIKESQELLQSLENSNQDLRNLSHQMMPRALKELGITSALNDLLDSSLGYSNIKYSLEHFNIKERLPQKIEITIYRITQELINNILRHSKASEVSFQLFKANNSVILIAEDNGVGFLSNKNTKGIGLLNISSRLDMVKGNVHFESNLKRGTLVTIKIPL